MKGFTLVELIFVAGIIVVLSFLVVISATTARQRARDARRISDIAQVQLALQQYFKATKRYPNPDPQGYCGLAAVLAPYLTQLPKDPLDNSGACNGTNPYYYEYYASGLLQPQEALLRIPLNVVELPGSLASFAADEDGNIAPQTAGASWIGGAKAGSLACPAAVPCATLNCGTAPESSVATAVYCIRL